MSDITGEPQQTLIVHDMHAVSALFGNDDGDTQFAVTLHIDVEHSEAHTKWMQGLLLNESRFNELRSLLDHLAEAVAKERDK